MCTLRAGYWLAFTAPDVDKLFGTAPQPKDVQVSALAAKRA